MAINQEEGHIYELIQEQLKAGHMEPTDSPWNAPILTIPKKVSGKLQLLHDLKTVNATVHTMRAWQPGLPVPSQIPLNWSLIVVNLKNFFPTIPLAPKQKFAFSVPSINNVKPMKKYQWKVLPQGMMSSPTLCQKYIAQAIQPCIIHYMDNLLLASQQEKQTLAVFTHLKQRSPAGGLRITGGP